MADRKELAMLVKKTIAEGGKTKEMLVELEDIKDTRALGRVFADLRFLGFYPVDNGEGVFTLMEEDEFVVHEEAEKKLKLKEKEENAAKKKASKTPPKVRFQNKLVRFNNALLRERTNRYKFNKDNTNVLVKLRWNISQLQFQIAKIEYENTLSGLREELKMESNAAVAAALSNGIAKETDENIG